jgi:hypothetical protein
MRTAKNSGLPPFIEELRSRLTEVSVFELSQAMVASGVRKHDKFSKWMESKIALLEEFNITPDLQRLVNLGINRETLGIALILIHMAPNLDHFFKKIFGDKRTRQRSARSLVTAAGILDSMNKLVPGGPDSIGKIPSIETTMVGVKHYALMLTWGEPIYEFIGAHSIVELAKYALAGLVKSKTGKFHDREVSALTGAALQKLHYDETAHRVWRIRTYKRLDKSFPIAPKLLHAFDDALSKG